MLLGLGTDIAEVDRIRRSIERFGDHFLARVFTAREIAYCTDKGNAAERYAARFAAKEAGMKAIGSGWSDGVAWHDLEVGNEPSGRPILHLSGVAREKANAIGVQRIWLSLSHTATSALAVVVLED